MNNIEVKTIYGRIEDFENNYFFSPSISKSSLRLSAKEKLWAVKPIMSADISTAAKTLNRR